ncbi:hypothetical protein AZI86_05885 [Bdellovibrio bacteriovorus]|uniref:Uncharacterized protein n=1 Tax=Bdellovibrio bacteriovorus TaxID=959 RepID=A0A150WQG8_BDEBC|nr:hypothetical protein [Bdellovibrio bacteriovorus]KYG66574.1 hypothetical protein AZI86_05885 [Bdellovibrio bacteriovorus]
MKTKTIKYVCALSLLMAPNAVLATGTETTAGTISVKDSSDKTSSQNSAGQMMSYLTGAKLFGESAAHFAKCPKNGSQCALGALKAMMGALSMMQGGAHGGTAAGANYSSGLTDGSAGFTPAYNDPYAEQTAAAYQQAKDALAKLEKGVAGSKIDVKKGTLTTYDGKTYDLKNGGTPEGMAAAGFPPGAISGAMEYGAKISKEMQDKVDKLKLGAMTASGGYDEGGGGGRGYASSSDSSDGSGGGGSGVKLERDPANLAGMQKNYNGEPIGVAADSIFLMMNRRYKVKESQDSFYSDADIALKK